MIPRAVAELVELERWTCTSGDVGLEVAMNDGKSAICCSDLAASPCEEGSTKGAIPDDPEGEGDGGS
jgi:hypothetical protein